MLTKRPVVADDDEIARNPRARSAKLRAAERTEAPARDDDAVRSAAAAAVARRRAEGALSMRLLNILVIGALILAASFVYKIKFDSTLQAERVAKLRGEMRRERDAIAMLRAEWAKLDTPGRIQGLAERHLALQADRADAVRQSRPVARAPAADVPPADRSDRRHDRAGRARDDRQRAAAQR